MYVICYYEYRKEGIELICDYPQLELYVYVAIKTVSVFHRTCMLYTVAIYIYMIFSLYLSM